MSNEKGEKDAELEWIKFRQDTLGEHAFPEESKLMKKMKDNPFVPVGAGVTVMALVYGLYQFKTGNAKMSQKMMRARIAAQGFTIIAILGGILLGATSVSGNKSDPK